MKCLTCTLRVSVYLCNRRLYCVCFSRSLQQKDVLCVFQLVAPPGGWSVWHVIRVFQHVAPTEGRTRCVSVCLSTYEVFDMYSMCFQYVSPPGGWSVWHVLHANARQLQPSLHSPGNWAHGSVHLQVQTYVQVLIHGALKKESTHTHTHACADTHVHVQTHLCICTCTHTHTHICRYKSTCENIYTSLCLSLCLCLCCSVCVSLSHTHTHTHTHTVSNWGGYVVITLSVQFIKKICSYFSAFKNRTVELYNR